MSGSEDSSTATGTHQASATMTRGNRFDVLFGVNIFVSDVLFYIKQFAAQPNGLFGRRNDIVCPA